MRQYDTDGILVSAKEIRLDLNFTRTRYYAYDERGRLKEIASVNSNVNLGTQPTIFLYDSMADRITEKSAFSKATHEYDAKCNRISFTRYQSVSGDAVAFMICYHYDEHGNVIEEWR